MGRLYGTGERLAPSKGASLQGAAAIWQACVDMHGSSAGSLAGHPVRTACHRCSPNNGECIGQARSGQADSSTHFISTDR